jgi:hypothetical protein
MATYYVRPDGSNANTGTGPAAGQAWLTVQYALTNAVLTTGINYIYIAPGVYRESVVLNITPTVSNTLVISGDPTAAQFTGVAQGVVRLTNFVTDNARPSSSRVFFSNTKSYFTLENIYIDGLKTDDIIDGALVDIKSCTNVTIRKMVIVNSAYFDSFAAACYISTAASNTNIVIECSYFTCQVGLIIGLPSSGTVYNPQIAIRNCHVLGNYAGVMVTANGAAVTTSNGVNVFNCTIYGITRCIWFNTSNTATPSTLYNSLIMGIGTGATGIILQTANVLTENFNKIRSANSGTNISVFGANTTTAGSFGIDQNYSRIVGLPNLSALQSYYLSPNANAGTSTGAPLTDIYGVTWSGANPDIGAGTYATPGNIGVYNPTERNASTITIAPGSTSQSIELYLGATGLTASTSGLSARYNRTRTASVSIPLVARTIAQAWTAGGFAEVDATNMPGVYRLDLPDAALAAGADDVTVVVRGASGTNGAVMTIKLSSGGLTSAQTASAVWGASPAGYLAETDFGGVVNATRNVAGNTEILAQNIPANVWDELKANHTIPNSFGDYLDTKVSTGADTSRIQLRQGPFLIKQNAIDSVITEVNQFLSTVPNIEMVLIDSSGGSVSVAGATLVMRVRNQAGTAVVNNVTPTVAYADGGVIRWSPNLSWTALGVTTAGTYRIVVERTMSGVTTTFGPFLVQLSSG